MNTRRDLVAEADHHSSLAMDPALGCIEVGRREPATAPAMVGAAFGFAGLGIAIASVGIFAGLWRAAQIDNASRNAVAH